MFAASIATATQGEGRKRRELSKTQEVLINTSSILTLSAAASMLAVDRTSAAVARSIQRNAAPEVTAAVRAGHLTLHSARTIAGGAQRKNEPRERVIFTMRYGVRLGMAHKTHIVVMWTSRGRAFGFLPRVRFVALIRVCGGSVGRGEEAPAERGHSLETKADAGTASEARQDGHVTATPPREPSIDRLFSVAIHDLSHERHQTRAVFTPTRTGIEDVDSPTSADALIFHAITVTVNKGSMGSGCSSAVVIASCASLIRSTGVGGHSASPSCSAKIAKMHCACEVGTVRQAERRSPCEPTWLKLRQPPVGSRTFNRRSAQMKKRRESPGTLGPHGPLWTLVGEGLSRTVHARDRRRSPRLIPLAVKADN